MNSTEWQCQPMLQYYNIYKILLIDFYFPLLDLFSVAKHSIEVKHHILTIQEKWHFKKWEYAQNVIYSYANTSMFISIYI